MKLYEVREYDSGGKHYIEYDLKPAHRILDACSWVAIGVMFVALVANIAYARRYRKRCP